MRGDMSLYSNNFNPYLQNENNGNGFCPQYDNRTYGGYPGGAPGLYPGQGVGFPGGGFPGQGGGIPGGGFPGQGGGVPGAGMPGSGFPSQGGGSPGDGQGEGPPTSPPPSYIPQESQASTFAVDPGGIRRCLRRFTYIWLNDGKSFWFYPVFVGSNSVAGWRWSRRRGWVYFGIGLWQIRSFQC